MANNSNDGGLAMPMTPEDITTEWLSNILGHEVRTFEITRTIMNQTTGKVFVDVSYEDIAAADDGRLPAQLCLKGSFNPAMANMPSYADLLYMTYAQEVVFFNDVAPKLSASPLLRLPKVWWAGTNPEQKQGICAMEDLGKRPGIRFGDGLHPSSIGEAKAVVEQLAALHAMTWEGSADAESPGPSAIGTYETVLLMLTMGWEVMVLSPDRPQIPPAYRDQARTTAALKKHFATRNPRFHCLVHNDAHISNLFFDESGPAYLDWQFAAAGSAFHDVAYYITGALSVEDRRKHEDEVLNHYLAALARLGGPKLEIDDQEVRREYRKCVIAGMCWVLTPNEMQGRERVRAMVERFAAAFEDHGVIELIESLPAPVTVA